MNVKFNYVLPQIQSKQSFESPLLIAEAIVHSVVHSSID